MSVVVGVDIAKNKFDYRIITEGNDRLSKGSIEMTGEGFCRFLEDPNVTKDALFVMESTGLYHIALMHFLNNSGFMTRCVNLLLVKKQITADSLRKTKTDSTDALSIANYGRLHYDLLRGQGSAMDEEVKTIARRRQQIAQDIARTKTQLKADLVVAWPEILAVNVFTDTMLRFLSEFGCASEVRGAVDEDILATLVHKGRGRGASISVEQIRNLAENSIGVSYRSDMVKDSAEKLISLQKREERITDSLHEHEQKVHAKEIEILTSMPGVGKVSACQFMAEIGDIKRFSSYQKLIAFAGTDPSIYQSGQQLFTGHITKHGNANLRRICYIMATKNVTWNPVIRDYYTKKRDQGFSHRKAMIAAANKMLKVIFVLLSRGESFKLIES